MKTRFNNPSNIHRNSQGKLVDKYGREIEEDWEAFDKLRGKRNAPVLSASKTKT